MDAKERRGWRVDLRTDPWKERATSLLCGLGICIPVGRGIVVEQSWPIHWSGDRWCIIILFIAIATIALWGDDD